MSRRYRTARMLGLGKTTLRDNPPRQPEPEILVHAFCDGQRVVRVYLRGGRLSKIIQY